MTPISKALPRLSLALGSILFTFAASANNTWPSGKPITWVVGFSPGGSVDVITRTIAQRVGASLGQDIVVENKAGAAGGIALSTVARARPDGYTLVTVAGPILRPENAPDIGNKLEGIATLAEGAVVLVGPSDGPKNLSQLTAAIRQAPSKFSYASSGIGTGQHIAGEMFNLSLDTPAVIHVPYKGGSQAISDILGGQVQLGFLGVSTVLPQISQGKLTAYAVTTPHRISALPEVPTFEEAGIPGFKLTQWYIAGVPAGTPDDIKARLKQAISDALATDDVQKVLQTNGLDLPGDESKDATKFAANSLEQARQVAKAANITLQ